MAHLVLSLLALLLALLLPLTTLAQTNGDGTYGYGDNNNNTQPQPQPQPQQPNMTRPNATRPSDQNATSTDAAAFLPITLSNNNSWVTGRSFFEQNNYLLQNIAARPICDVSIKTPLADANTTRISSAYNVEVRNTSNQEMHFDLPFYLTKIWQGQVVSFGWILRLPDGKANGTATGGQANVTSARFCEPDEDPNNGQHRLRRRRVLVHINRCA